MFAHTDARRRRRSLSVSRVVVLNYTPRRRGRRRELNVGRVLVLNNPPTQMGGAAAVAAAVAAACCASRPTSGQLCDGFIPPPSGIKYVTPLTCIGRALSWPPLPTRRKPPRPPPPSPPPPAAPAASAAATLGDSTADPGPAAAGDCDVETEVELSPVLARRPAPPALPTASLPSLAVGVASLPTAGASATLSPKGPTTRSRACSTGASSGTVCHSRLPRM